MRADRVILLYDGGCNFCLRSLTALKRFDRLERLQLIDATNREQVQSRFPETKGADFDAAMYAIADDKLYRGFDAFRRAMRACPRLSRIALLLYVPGVPQLGRIVYDAIARNRHRLGCSSEVCEP